MNKKNFDIMMSKFGMMYEKRIKPDILEIYFNLFKEIPDKQVEYITRECLKKCHYFPRPADVFNRLKEFEEDIDYPVLE